MPELPAFLANVLEPRFARPAQVVEVEPLSPRFRRVRFAGQALRGVSFTPGQEIEFRVSARAFRHYTPSRFDAEAGEVEVIFFLHGHGPGSRWAAELATGREVNVLGPGGRLRLRDGREHVFLGDETTVGLFVAMAHAATARVVGAIELDTDEHPVLEQIGLELDAIPRLGQRGEALLDWLGRNQQSPDIARCFYLAGHTGTIVRLRSALRSAGWERTCIRTKPYWADGKRGL
ncbi:MAG: siderophore-interacting protein [Myxococcota bacterium]